jgi:alpha-galactosidase
MHKSALSLPLFWASFAALLNYTSGSMNAPMANAATELPTVYAAVLREKVDGQGFPEASSWQKAPAIQFDRDWKGENPDAERSTEVRVLWDSQTLFLRFFARYRAITVFPDARSDGWRDQLWDRDVAEAFLQPDSRDPLRYKEFEVSPNGFWIDLNISHGEKEEMRSGLRRRVSLDDKTKTWTAELAIPLRSMTNNFDPKMEWRVNFYRVEGASEPRFYSAWSPTMSSEPNFHVPAAFGRLQFRQ